MRAFFFDGGEKPSGVWVMAGRECLPGGLVDMSVQLIYF